MQPNATRFRSYLESAIEDRAASSIAERGAIYDSLREKLERRIASDPAKFDAETAGKMRAGLENALKAFEADFVARQVEVGRPAPGVAENQPAKQEDKPVMAESRASKRSGRLWLLSLAGLVAIGAVAYAAHFLSGGTAPATDKPAPAAATPSGSSPAATAASSFRASGAIAFELADGNQARTNEAEGFTTLSSTIAEPKPGGKTNGAAITLNSDFEQAFGGRTIEVTISARRSAVNGSDALLAAYSTASVGNSGWRKLPLGPDFADMRFRYAVPRPKGKKGLDFLGILADPTASGKSVDIRQIRIDVVD